jgi:transposase
MAKPLLDDGLWERIQPLPQPPRPCRFHFPGRKRLDDHKVLTGILFVLKTGISWEELPCELGCGCGMTCLNRLKEWHRAGVWKRLHQLSLSELRQTDQIDWSRATADAAFARALGGGADTGPNPTDRGKLGSKHHVLTDAQGVPLAIHATAANVNEVTQLVPLVDAVPPVGTSSVTRSNGWSVCIRTGGTTPSRCARNCDGAASPPTCPSNGRRTAAAWG